jgi:hypothetical protein
MDGIFRITSIKTNMTDNSNDRLPPTNGLMSSGESTRSPEFKAARDELVTNVNGWLDDMAKLRDSGTSLPDGSKISGEPRVVRTNLDKVAANPLDSTTNLHRVAEKVDWGTAVMGDGQSSPIELQAVRPDGSETEIVEAKGTDPISKMVHGNNGYESSRQNEVVVSFGVRTLPNQGAERYFRYDVMGSGNVVKAFVDEKGYHVQAPLRTQDDLSVAVSAFEEVKNTVIPVS